jgi:flagellar FliL protein
LPGKFFLVEGQKKDSINHYYLSVRIKRARLRWGLLYRVTGLAAGIAFNPSRSGPGGAMADTEQADGAAEGTEVVAAPKGKLKLIIAAAALVLVVGGAATWFFFFRHYGEEMHAEAPVAKPPVFVDVPEMLVNLVGAPGERVQYLKVKVVLEVKEEKQLEAIKPTMPRVTDIFQTYLRELRPSDLNGSAGLFRLREELARRVNAAISPSQVNAVLFKEIVVQ